MPVYLSRLLVVAELDAARDLFAVLAAIAGTAPSDLADTESATVTVGRTVIEVAVGEAAAPSLIELRTDRPLAGVLDEVVELIGSASTAPSDPDAPIEAVTAHVGKVTVKVTATAPLVPFLMARLGEAEIAGETIDAAFWRGSLRHVRKMQGEMTRIQEQVLALIPERERGAISALAVEEAMPRMQAAVDAAVAEAKAVSDEILREDQAHRAEREADHG